MKLIMMGWGPSLSKTGSSVQGLSTSAAATGHTFGVVFEIDQNSLYEVKRRATRLLIQRLMVYCREIVHCKTQSQKLI